MRTHLTKVVRANKTLAGLEWTAVGQQLAETLTNRIRLERHEAVSLSSKVRSATDLYAQFFEIVVAARLDHVEGILTSQLKPVNDQLASLTDAVMGDEIDDLINQARDLVNERRFPEAAAYLKQAASNKRSKATDRQRYRIASNYGAIAFAENRLEDAARHFFEAVRLAPEEELARINEVFAHYLLGNRKRAFELATDRRNKYPFSARLVGIWINSAPEDLSPEQLTKSLDSAVLVDAEVCVALARRCIMANKLDRADEYCADAILANRKWSQPWIVSAQVGIGKLMEENAGLRTVDGGRESIFQKALDEASEAIKASENDGPWATAEARAVRAQLLFIRGETARGTEDAKAAYKLAPDILSVQLLMAQCYLMAGETARAIELLAEAYEQEKRADIVLLYARTLASRGKEGDLSRAVGLVTSIDVGKVPSRMRDSFVVSTAQFMARIGDWNAAASYLQTQSSAIHSVTALAVNVLIFVGRDDRESANRLADEALAALSDEVQAGTKEFLGGLLMQLDRAKDALPVFQELFDKDIPTFDPRQLIACADHLQLHDKVLEVFDRVHSKRPLDWQMLEFEVQRLEQYHREKAIERLLEFLQRHPGHKLAQLRLSITAMLQGRPELARTEISDLPTVDELPPNYILAALGLLRQATNYDDAIDYGYRYLRGHFDRQEAHEAYIQVVVMRPHRDDESPELDVVGPDSAVYCQEVGSGEFRWFVLEDTDKPVRDFEEISLADPRAANLTGKRVGDTFVLAAAPMANREAVIRKIQTKYVRRFQDCMTELQVRFGPSTMLQSVYVGPPDTIQQPGMVTIMTDLQNRAKRLEQVQELYAKNPVSFHIYGASLGKNAYLALEHIACTPGLSVKCFEGAPAGPDVSLMQLRERPLMLVDLTAIATIRLLGLEWLFTTNLYSFAVTQGTWEELHDTLVDEKGGSGTRAHVRFEKERFVWEERDADAADQLRLENQAFLDSFQENVRLVSATDLAAIPPEEREQMKQCFGVYGAETMAVAGKGRAMLWTDDSTLGILAASTLGAKRTWTQIVLLSFVEAGILSKGDYNKAVAKLIGFGYTLTFFDPACVLEACKLSEFGAARFPLKQAIEVFREIAMPSGMLVRLFLEFFIALQQEPLLFQKKSLIVRAFLDALWANPASHDLVLALRPMSSKLFGLNVVAEAEFNAAFDDWLRSLNRPVLSGEDRTSS